MDDQPTAELVYRRPSFSFRQFSREFRWRLDALIAKVALAAIRWTARDSNYLSSAKREFNALYKDLPQSELEGPNTWIRDNVFDLLAVLNTQGHSGGSIGYCLSTFKTLAEFKCLTPLTGEDSEWIDVSEFSGEIQYQNNRISSVFKNGDGQAYDIDGYYFLEDNGCTYTNYHSRKNIEFPYLPERMVCVPVDANGVPKSEEHRKLTGRFE